MFSVSPGSSTTQTILEPALLLSTTYKSSTGTISNVNPADVKATFTNTSGNTCSDEWGLTAAPVIPALATGTNVYGIPFTSSATSGSNASSSGQTGKVTVCADYKPNGSTKYYQASTTITDDSYTSTTAPPTLQIPFATTAPGQCP